jgi:monoamine oxidase
MFHPVGGMDQIPRAFERAIGPQRITLDAEVRSVHQTDTAVEVIYLDTKTGATLRTTADFVVACLLLTVLYVHTPVGDLGNQPVTARVEHALAHASKVHPQIRGEFEGAYGVWWRRVKYSQGGFATGRGRRTATTALARG